jgi:lipid-A-disaccharide synthase
MDRRQGKKILVVAGEASGDLHGGLLIREVRQINSRVHFFGIGGDSMANAGMEIIHHVRDLAFVGFFEVIKHLPYVRRIYREMASLLDKKKPDLVLLIDYPGFNLRFAREANRRNIPVFYYISPQVWAWKAGRVKTIARRVKRIVVILPFEEDIYRKAGVDVHFTGHPLKDTVHPGKGKTEFYQKLGLNPRQLTVGILPGSRNLEVSNLLPEMIKAFHLLKKRLPELQGILAKADTISDEIYNAYLKESDLIFSVRKESYDVLTHCDAALVASGTATLETALLGTPMVILYKVAPLTAFIVRRIIRISFVGLVNIVAGKEVVPEILQEDVQAEIIAEKIFPLLTDENEREEIKKSLQEISEKLGKPGASRRAAEKLVEILK